MEWDVKRINRKSKRNGVQEQRSQSKIERVAQREEQLKKGPLRQQHETATERSENAKGCKSVECVRKAYDKKAVGHKQNA